MLRLWLLLFLYHLVWLSFPKKTETNGSTNANPKFCLDSAIAHLETSAEPLSKTDVATDVGKRTELSKIAATEGLKVVVPVVEIVASPAPSLAEDLVVPMPLPKNWTGLNKFAVLAEEIVTSPAPFNIPE